MFVLGSGAARTMSNLHLGGLSQCALERALAELDLECVVSHRACLHESLVDGRVERGVVEALALEQRFRFMRPPRQGGDAAECDANLARGLPIEIDGDGR